MRQTLDDGRTASTRGRVCVRPARPRSPGRPAWPAACPTAVRRRDRRRPRVPPGSCARGAVSTASISCRTVKIVARTSGATRVPWRCSSSVSSSTRSIESRPRSSSRLASGRTAARSSRRATISSAAACAGSAAHAASASASGRASDVRRRRAIAQPPLDLVPPDLAGGRARQRLHRDVVAQDPLVRGQAARTGLRSRTAAAPSR